jgi:hypothetical protein
MRGLMRTIGLPVPGIAALVATLSSKAWVTGAALLATNKADAHARLRLLVRVCMTSNPRAAPSSRAPGVEPHHLHTLRQTRCDQTRTAHVLHWLTEAQISTQRKQRNQLREADLRPLPRQRHGSGSLTGAPQFVARSEASSCTVATFRAAARLRPTPRRKRASL